MFTSCLAIASTTDNSKRSSDVSATFNGNLNDTIFPTEFGQSLDIKTNTFKGASMTKQLTNSSPTKPDLIASTLFISPVAPPVTTTNDISPRNQTELGAAEGEGCNNGKLLQKSNSNCIPVLPNSLAVNSLASIKCVNDAAPTVKSGGDSSGRSAALERAYVHDVYEHCEEPTGPIRPRIAQFLNNLEPGAVVCDVGCGNGRYLAHGNPTICTVGVDRCYRLSKVAREKGGEVLLCDSLELPFRDDSFDAVLSLAVVHHFATTERRVNALQELARVLRIGGRVIITVWALEQRHRRFESQDVLIPWQPPKIRTMSCSDEEDDDSFLPPYHAYTEDSTNSSRSAGDGDSSSLSSSSPGESCYSFVRRAIQKLAGGRRHPWFLDSWTSKETKNDSSLDYEDVKDLPIELRRLEDFEDFHEPPLSAGLKSRSLGSILNPPPRQIVRSRSSVPSLGGNVLHLDASYKAALPDPPYTTQHAHHAVDNSNGPSVVATKNNVSPTKSNNVPNARSLNSGSSLGRRPKLIKQKQSLCDDECQLPENPFQVISTYNSNNNNVSSNLYLRNGHYYNSNNNKSQMVGKVMNTHNMQNQTTLTARQMMQANIFLRKQSSLNEELMAVNRLREKERVRKRIQKQTSLNEAFLCRSAIFSKKLHVIRENFTKKMKTSTGSFERVTKTGINKLVQNLTAYIAPGTLNTDLAEKTIPETMESNTAATPSGVAKCSKYHHHHHHHYYVQQQKSLNLQNYQRQQGASTNSIEAGPHSLQKQLSLGNGTTTGNKYAGPVTYCNSADCSTTSACYCSTYHYTGCNTFCTTGDCSEIKEENARRHSKESGSDSSKDSSLQSDTSVESEDSFASVIFIPKPEQHQQQLNYQQQHQNSNSSSSNSSSSNGGGSANGGECHAYGSCCQHKNATCQKHTNGNPTSCLTCLKHQQHSQNQKLPSVPTSPLIMPCPPTPAHSPAAIQAVVTSPPQTVAAVTAAMAMLTPPTSLLNEGLQSQKAEVSAKINTEAGNNRFSFDEAHIKQHESGKKPEERGVGKVGMEMKITRQIVKNLPPIPKFRKQQSLQAIRQTFPIVRRSSGTASTSIPGMPKLMSLELFNPATDDLDSDSSEASTPNSIDSVISTGKSSGNTITMEQKVNEKSSPNAEQSGDLLCADDTDSGQVNRTRNQPHCDTQLNGAIPHNIFLNEEDSCPLPSLQSNTNTNAQLPLRKEHDFVEFAEQLNVQLLRKIEDKNCADEYLSLEARSELTDTLDAHIGVTGELQNKKRNNELRDLSAIREELRERRLMLANLSTQPSLQQSPSSSTSSLSSQTRSFTIHEENEEESDERSYSLQLYENCKISKINYKRNRPYNLNPETAYLLQEDGDIFEEEEEEAEHDNMCNHPLQNHDQIKVGAENGAQLSVTATRCDSIERTAETEQTNQVKGEHKAQNKQASLENRQSTESWGNSNSSTGSLESPSQGGSTTRHRYYHVFREGELDALINHHVNSLHIVSSYYERASWCVVAEKVQVWTI
ncbi:unnamed protein product [Ceratitis capitata]|uniref:(Mediterranean fruit fly) hypothetical protein n=1 Tax=Ceratitis capitata TaxID=7213 RepID=A0A811U054_CERCA|nr:unnamed protein product [Ceratitis capitata]